MLFHGKDGYFRQNGKLGSSNGFDGLFIKPAIDFTKPIDEINIEGIIINESKQIGGGFRMNGEGQKLPMQMTEEWVEDVIGRMATSKDPKQVKLAEILLREFDNNRQKFTRVVTGVDAGSETIGIIKLN
ncbi:hypothetical protein DYBT9275_02377 [Dyadobacter sp. CECT 9275]|uniref:Uncharacterized protein n=1 Tax=Dyadobacter helix TaxID=2822344 RepID=A0A916JBH7_9BACT|nr:hypothetical protein [Dyadobacter sp. CECT 9275]CAG5000067.1 hypothetical protein DYBT9275_02377 [Dyadobacter sp. CECT 9275]